MYVFRGNRINSGKEAVMPENYQTGSKTKSTVYSGQGEVSKSIPQSDKKGNMKSQSWLEAAQT